MKVVVSKDFNRVFSLESMTNLEIRITDTYDLYIIYDFDSHSHNQPACDLIERFDTEKEAKYALKDILRVIDSKTENVCDLSGEFC